MKHARRGHFLAVVLLLSIALSSCTQYNLTTQHSERVSSRQGLVVSQQELASRVGVGIMEAGGGAVDAAIATAFALAVVHPEAGNIGGGGFLLYRSATGVLVTYDFREQAPASASPTMFMEDGEYGFDRHHYSYQAVAVPGTVAGLHLAWQDHGTLPWAQLLQPAIELARAGFSVDEMLTESLAAALPLLSRSSAALAQFSKDGQPYDTGDMLVQTDLAQTLQRIAVFGPEDFYRGETARLIVAEMNRAEVVMTLEDLASYEAKRRPAIQTEYRGYEIIGMPPPSSGGVVIAQALNILEGYDLSSSGFGDPLSLHLIAEALRRGFASRALYLGDPEYVDAIPVERLISKDYAATLRGTIDSLHASLSSSNTYVWPAVSEETTHLSVVDRNRNAVALTYTLEGRYGSGILVTGGGFLLNNEMGDFNAGPGLTTANGLIGTSANLAEPGKRMLSSMSPTIVAKDGRLVMVTGSPGGRTIISTVLLTIVNVIDFGMSPWEAVAAPRLHHQWLPDQISYERDGFPLTILDSLAERGHVLAPVDSQGAAEVIVFDSENDVLEGAFDQRRAESGAFGF